MGSSLFYQPLGKLKPCGRRVRRSDVMKYVQIGILVSLLAIAGLLVGIYQKDATRPEQPDALTLEALPAEGPLSVQQASLRSPLPPEPAPVAPTEPRPAPRYSPAPPPVAAPEPQPEVAIVTAPEAPPPAPPPTRPAPLPMPEPPPVEKPREPREVTLRAGLPITVRLDHTVSTDRSRPGDTFTASLTKAIIEDGLIIADRGARVEGQIVDARRAGRVNGRSYLSLELTEIHGDDGQTIAIDTSVFSAEGEGQTKKSVKRGAIGAGIGAAIGAIAGGGGAGAGSAAVQGGEAVIFEAESRLSFRLASLASDVHVVERL